MINKCEFKLNSSLEKQSSTQAGFQKVKRTEKLKWRVKSMEGGCKKEKRKKKQKERKEKN